MPKSPGSCAWKAKRGSVFHLTQSRHACCMCLCLKPLLGKHVSLDLTSVYGISYFINCVLFERVDWIMFLERRHSTGIEKWAHCICIKWSSCTSQTFPPQWSERCEATGGSQETAALKSYPWIIIWPSYFCLSSCSALCTIGRVGHWAEVLIHLVPFYDFFKKLPV